MKDRRRKKSGALKALGIMLLLAAAVLAVVLAVRSRQEGGLKALWHELFGSEGTDEFFYENASGGGVADMASGLAVASTSGLYVYDSEGELTFSRLYSWRSPAITACGDYAAVYDVGGETVIFFTKDEVITELTFDNPVVSASVNSLGYLAVCTQEDTYYGAVTVYNSIGTAIYRWYSGAASVLGARVHDRDELLVQTVGVGGSRLILMKLDSEDPVGDYEYSGLMLDAEFTDSGITAVTTTQILGLSETLEEQWRYDFQGKYLTGFSLKSSASVFGLADFQVGGERSVVTLSDSGEELGSMELQEDIVDLELAYGTVAVLTGERVTLYSTALKERESFECDFGAESAVIRDDRSVLCAGAFSAYVYGGN